MIYLPVEIKHYYSNYITEACMVLFKFLLRNHAMKFSDFYNVLESVEIGLSKKHRV